MVTVARAGMHNPRELEYNATSGLAKMQAEGRCRMCLRPSSIRCLDGYELIEGEARPLTRHHLVPISWFRSTQGRRYAEIRNANANIVPLCRPCHDLIEDDDMIARRMLRRLLTQREVAFAVRYRGIAWLNRRYPNS